MLVRDLMTRDLVTVRADTPILEARTLMAKRRLRHLPVTDGDRLLGIITDRDIRLSLPSDATSLSVWELNYLLARLTVGQAMTTLVIAIAPERDAREAAELMLGHKVGALPVVDGERLVGIVTETDIVRLFARGPAVAGPAVAAG
jgi:acetoin utilization protein AcuB